VFDNKSILITGVTGSFGHKCMYFIESNSIEFIKNIFFLNRGNRHNSNVSEVTGKLAKQGFAYCSGTNPDFLSVEDVKKYNQMI